MSLSFDNTEIAFKYRSDKELKQAHFLFSSMGSATLTKIGISMTSVALSLNLPVRGLIKNTIFKQFCGGETLQEAAATSSILGKYNVGVALDYGVEGKHEESDFDAAVPEFVNAIKYAATQANIPFIPIKVTGFARFALLEKIDAKKTLTEAEVKEWERVQHRIDVICKAAHDCNIMILVDAEESWIQQPVDDLTDLMMEQYNKEKAIVFNTFQMYRHDRLAFLKVSHEKATQRNYILGAKIVRGAYMEKERARAAEMGYESPIQPNKAATDRDYDAAVDYCLAHNSNVTSFFGTHNEDSCMLATKIMADKKIDNNDDSVYLAQLYGMSDNITFNLASSGYHVCKYLPYGPVTDVVPYLMRRAQENTSVKGQTGRELSLIKKEMKRRGI